MVSQPDENLPEVVPSTEPEWISSVDAQRAWGYEGHAPKYPVQYDHSDSANKELLFSPTSPDGPAPPAASPTASERGGTGGSRTSGHDAEDLEKKDDSDPIIFRMKKRTFIIVVAVIVLLLVALAVGLGVGLGKKSSSGDVGADGDAEAVGDGAASTSSDNSPQTTTTTTKTSATADATTSDEPTATDDSESNSDDDTTATPTATPTGEVFGDKDFSFQGWSEDNYGGRKTPEYKDEGFWYFGFNITSYVWDHGAKRCCVTFCQGLNGTGWWCDDRGQPHAAGPISHIQIWCDQMNDVHIGQCSEDD